MSIKDRLKTMLDYTGDADDEYEYEYEDEEEEAEAEKTVKPEDNGSVKAKAKSFGTSSSKVVNISTTAQLQIVVAHPKQYADVKFIADHLKEKRTVVVNFDNVDKDEKKRIVDFLRGVTYALNGNGKKVGPGAYLLTPYNVGLTDEESAYDAIMKNPDSYLDSSDDEIEE